MCVCRFLAVLTFALALPLPAAAGPWTRAEGTGQVISASGREVAPIGAFAGSVPESDKGFFQVQVEYGLTDTLTAGARLYLDLSTTDPQDGKISVGMLARQRLWQGEGGSLVSIEAFGTVPAERMASSAMARSNPDSASEAGAALLAGTSWWGDWGSAWAAIGAGGAWRAEGQADEFRGEISVGYRPRLCCAAMLALYGVQPLSGEDGASLKIAPSFAYTFLPEIGRNEKKPPGPINAVTLQIGLSYDVIDAPEGLGFQIAWWRPF